MKQLDRRCNVSLLVDRQRVPPLLEFVRVLDFPHRTTLLLTHITCKLFLWTRRLPDTLARQPVGARNSDVAVEQGKSPPILMDVYRLLYRFLSSLARLAVRSGRSKDIELIVLRHQLSVLHRQHNRPTLNEDDRSMLAAIAQALPRPLRTDWLVPPDTLLRWHRRRIARHWTQPAQKPGRPSTHTAIRRLIIQMATDNPTWGYRRIHGELTSLGHHIGASTVWRILKEKGINPAPNRSSVTWSQFLRSQAATACDFASVDTALLGTVAKCV